MSDDVVGNVSQDWDPRIVAFFCNWCTYAGADLEHLDVLNASMGTHLARPRAEALVTGLNDALRRMGLEWPREAQKLYELARSEGGNNGGGKVADA